MHGDLTPCGLNNLFAGERDVQLFFRVNRVPRLASLGAHRRGVGVPGENFSLGRLGKFFHLEKNFLLPQNIDKIIFWTPPRGDPKILNLSFLKRNYVLYETCFGFLACHVPTPTEVLQQAV